MFVLLSVLYCETFSVARSMSSVYEDVQTGKQRVTKSAHQEADVTQAGEIVIGHETNRKRTREEIEGLVKKQDWLVKKAGKKNKRSVVTKMKEAMGFSEELPGKPEKRRLDVMQKENERISILGNEFSPHQGPQVYTGQFFCDDGRCPIPMSEITG